MAKPINYRRVLAPNVPTPEWMPRFTVPGRVKMIPGGRTGVDYKMVISTYEPHYHYTARIGWPSFPGNLSVPIYFEKTLESLPKAHRVFAEGTIDFGSLISGMSTFMPEIRVLPPESLTSTGGEFIVFNPSLLSTFTSGEVVIDDRLFEMMQPVEAKKVWKEDFAFAAPVNSTGSGAIIHTPKLDISITFPPLETIEERIERSATISKVDRIIEPDEEEFVDY